MISRSPVEYYMLNETTVDEETNRRGHRILHENVVDSPGGRIFTVTFRQVLQSAGTKNWNGRIYSADLIENAIKKNPLIQEDLKRGTWGGEYGHPIIEKGMNELARQMTLFPPNVCWVVKNPHMEGNLLIGECTTVAGGYGDMLRDRILSGVPAMSSSRAVGGVDAKGNVLPGYTLCYFDSVWRPSHKEAYLVDGSSKVNSFSIPMAPAGNTMTESATRIAADDPGFKDFLLTESVSRQKICQVCDAMRLNYDTMRLDESNLYIERTDDTSRTTVVLPLNKLVSHSMACLWN